MKNFTLREVSLSDTSIDVAALVEAIMDDGQCCSQFIKHSGSYECDRVLWLGFCDSSPIALSRSCFGTKDWMGLAVKYGNPHKIAAMMSAVLRRDGLPYIVQADCNDSSCSDRKSISNIGLEVYEMVEKE